MVLIIKKKKKTYKSRISPKPSFSEFDQEALIMANVFNIYAIFLFIVARHQATAP